MSAYLFLYCVGALLLLIINGLVIVGCSSVYVSENRTYEKRVVYDIITKISSVDTLWFLMLDYCTMESKLFIPEKCASYASNFGFMVSFSVKSSSI